MPRSMVGLLVAVGTAMSALVAFAHGYLAGLIIAIAAVVAGTAAYVVAPYSKNLSDSISAPFRLQPTGSLIKKSCSITHTTLYIPSVMSASIIQGRGEAGY